MNYHDTHTHISASLLKAFAVNPQLAKAMLENQTTEKSEALMIGSIFHEVMEVGTTTAYVFNADERPEPDKTFASKLNKEWKESIYSAYDVVIESEKYDEIQRMAASVKASAFYQRLQGTQLESIEEGYYLDLPNGTPVKCKPDALYNGKNGELICVDWKTTGDSLSRSPKQYASIIKRYGYDLQAVHYTEALRLALGREVRFFFVFVEKSEPYSVVPVYIDREGELYNAAFEQWNSLLPDLYQAMLTGEFPTLESVIENNFVTL